MLDNQKQGSLTPHTASIDVEAQVAHAQKMQALVGLVSTIAHDLENVWTPIAGYTDLMLAYVPENNPMRADLEQIRKATDAASSIMRKLTDFARTKRPGAWDFDLGELLVTQAQQLRQLLGPNIELILQLTPGPWQIKAHSEQIAQLVTHLATNTREAIRGSGTLRLVIENIHLTRQLTNRFVAVPQGEYVALTVIDNGPGIPEAIQEHLFEPGVTTKRGKRGVGFGLATCYSITQQHDGFIWLDTTPGQGTTVSLYLPRVRHTDTLTAYEFAAHPDTSRDV